MNISQINFIHDEAIISDINVLKDIANITVISDPSGNLPIIDNEASETRNSISEFGKTLTADFKSILASILNHTLLYLCVIIIVISIIINLRQYVRERRQSGRRYFNSLKMVQETLAD